MRDRKAVGFAAGDKPPPYSARARLRAFRRRRDGGFTLVEMMIVVVIITILSAIAIVGWRRWIARARTSEAVAMLSEMLSKEQSYFLEFGAYLPLRGDNDLVSPSANENGAAFYPSSPDAADFESARTAVSIANSALWPGAWRSIGLRPRYAQLFCTYIGNAGARGEAPPAGTMGAGLIGATTATTPAWFYALAACNLNGPSGYPAAVTVLGVSTNYANIATFNDGR